MENEKYLKTIIIEKFLDDNLIEKEDVVIDESRINIFLNGNKAISMMCIPKDQDAHAVGFLMSENVISSVDDIESITLSEDGLNVYVNANIDEHSLENLYKEKHSSVGVAVELLAILLQMSKCLLTKPI